MTGFVNFCIRARGFILEGFILGGFIREGLCPYPAFSCTVCATAVCEGDNICCCSTVCKSSKCEIITMSSIVK